jgi:hypothetical protein
MYLALVTAPNRCVISAKLVWRLPCGAARRFPRRGRAASLRSRDHRSSSLSAAASTRGRALRAWASPRSCRRPWGGPAALIAATEG